MHVHSGVFGDRPIRYGLSLLLSGCRRAGVGSRTREELSETRRMPKSHSRPEDAHLEHLGRVSSHLILLRLCLRISIEYRSKPHQRCSIPASLAPISCWSQGDHALSSHVLLLRIQESVDQADLRNTLHPSSLLWSMAEQSTRKYLRDVPLPQEHVTTRLLPIAESRSTPLTEGKQPYSLSILVACQSVGDADVAFGQFCNR